MSKYKINFKETYTNTLTNVGKDYIEDFEKMTASTQSWMTISTKKINIFLNKYRDLILHDQGVMLIKASKTPDDPLEHKYVIYAFINLTYKKMKKIIIETK